MLTGRIFSPWKNFIRSVSFQSTLTRRSTVKPKEIIDPVASRLPLTEALTRINSQYPRLYARLLIHTFPFTVTPTDLIVAHRIKGVQVGDVIDLTRILEVGSSDYKLIGSPLLPTGAVTVRATVMEHTEGAKKRAKMKRQRKGRRPLKTIKPHITTLRIQNILVDPAYNDNSNNNHRKMLLSSSTSS